MHNRAARLHDHLLSQMPAAIEMLRRMVSINSFTANPQGVDELGRLTADVLLPWAFRRVRGIR
jgi:hypothetical protein